MKIVFCIGYANPQWNALTWQEKGIGGSEYCVIKLSEQLAKHGHEVYVIGDVEAFDAKLVEKIRKAEDMTKDNKDLVLNIAANYGGRWDIVNAAKQLATQVKSGELDVENISEDALNAHISTANLPELDLLIRTGGEHRISNFLLWQCAYAELYFTDVLWPDFNEDVFQLAVDDFNVRQRRFGLTGEQVVTADG